MLSEDVRFRRIDLPIELSISPSGIVSSSSNNPCCWFLRIPNGKISGRRGGEEKRGDGDVKGIPEATTGESAVGFGRVSSRSSSSRRRRRRAISAREMGFLLALDCRPEPSVVR
jgi:hypothetical protein